MISTGTRKIITQNLKSIPGWRTHKKIVVFESDDWGSLRMPSFGSFEKLEKLGLDLRSADAERFNLNDNLATSHDLENLFEVISSPRDKNGNSSVFTPICIVANPDFEKIYDSGFQDYFYEPFNETLKRFPGCENSFKLWKEGVEKQLFVPQMHGREHLNVSAWMAALKNGDRLARLAFDESVWGFVPDQYPNLDYQAAFLLTDPHELEYHKGVISEGLQLFENLLGYRAQYFVPPNAQFNNSLNQVLANGGIEFRSTSQIQNESIGLGKWRKVIHYLGQKERNGIKYIIRNCIFEPSMEGKDWVDSCLHEIDIAFRWRKPAIISSHRANYIGSLNPSNRESGLNELSRLLKKIIRNWPDVEFMTTPQLGKLMNKDY